MPYKPKIGEDLPLSIAAKTRYVTELTRSAIALSVVVATVLALCVTAAICLYRGDFQILLSLWAVVAAPLGWVIGHYFRGTNTNGQKDNASTA
jgi:hypothetical protein